MGGRLWSPILVNMACWEQLSALPQPWAQCWAWLRAENTGGREPAVPRQCGLTILPACQRPAGYAGNRPVLLSLRPPAQLCNLIAPGAISRWATAATQFSFQNLSIIFLSFPFLQQSGGRRAQCVTRCGG